MAGVPPTDSAAVSSIDASALGKGGRGAALWQRQAKRARRDPFRPVPATLLSGGRGRPMRVALWSARGCAALRELCRLVLTPSGYMEPKQGAYFAGQALDTSRLSALPVLLSPEAAALATCRGWVALVPTPGSGVPGSSGKASIACIYVYICIYMCVRVCVCLRSSDCGLWHRSQCADTLMDPPAVSPQQAKIGERWRLYKAAKREAEAAATTEASITPTTATATATATTAAADAGVEGTAEFGKEEDVNPDGGAGAGEQGGDGEPVPTEARGGEPVEWLDGAPYVPSVAMRNAELLPFASLPLAARRRACVFAHLWKLGYHVSSGSKFGADMLAYASKLRRMVGQPTGV